MVISSVVSDHLTFSIVFGWLLSHPFAVLGRADVVQSTQSRVKRGRTLLDAGTHTNAMVLSLTEDIRYMALFRSS
jgi:hypothetical protein